MRSRLRFWKYPLSIIMLLLVIAAFTIIYALSITVKAPYERIDEPGTTIMETPEPGDDPEDPEDPDEAGSDPEDEPEPDIAEVFNYNPTRDGFVTIFMEEADIHRGHLLLINNDHEYIIPDDLDLVHLVDEKTSPFRVQHASSRVARSIVEPLDEMMDAFMYSTNYRSVAVISSFRTYENQRSILNNYISRMGRREALRWAAVPGHSEHHTGLAIDFGIMYGNTRSTFTGTGTTSWFRRNSHRFGFILRYQQNKTHITETNYEPWHFRYVGLPHSTIMAQNDWCLEEYIELLRDYTFDNPFTQEIDGIKHEIYFTTSTEVPVPLFSEFEISGNNIDGFIVTIIRLEHDPNEITDVSI